ncbi:MAG: molybdopterin-binding/glycosyltransferase family 2 protein [Pseudomonadota bacterium]
MKFGLFPVEDAVGGILAHGVRLPDDSILKKGRTLDSDLADLLLAASIEEVAVAILEKDDVGEDEAATRVSKVLLGSGIHAEVAKTGRVNLFAEAAGLFRVDAELISRVNSIDPGITVATLPNYADVNEGRMVATIKIIPYGVSRSSVERIEALTLYPELAVAPYQSKRIGLISTLLPGIKQSVLDKTRRNMEKRLIASGSTVVSEERVFHLEGDAEASVKSAIDGCDILVMFGASAVSDGRDVIPAAIEGAGGSILRFGMPVDPGNLLLLAELDGKPVIGAPGCARSLAENGFDWVLNRLLAGMDVGEIELSDMGVGGLLMETGARPHPREKNYKETRIAALVLAAGQSRRMGKVNKLTTDVHGKPMVRHAVDAVSSSGFAESVVVTGHDSDQVRNSLHGMDCKFADNPDFANGLSTSLVAGIRALSSDVTHAAVILGDMPDISSDNLDQLISESKKHPEHIILATSSGKRGNPVVWPARFFSELLALEGDVGARHIIAANGERVIEVEIGEPATRDIDTPTALRELLATPSVRGSN